MKSSRYMTLSAAALAVMLSACGGGGEGGTPAGNASSAKVADTPAGNAEVRFGDATLLTTNAVVGKAMQSGMPISSQAGVRGDVLLTMLDQRPCKAPVQSSSYNGEQISGGPQGLPRMEADQHLDPFNYQQIGGPSPNSRYMFHINGECKPEYFRYQAVQPGSYNLKVYSSPYFRGPNYDPKVEARFKRQALQVPLTVMTDSASVGSVVRSDGVDLNSGREVSFRHDDRISWGVLQYWQNGDASLRMLVLPGDADNEARLCWNPDGSQVKRLHCMSWRAPEGWKRGEPLDLVGQYLIDDRSTYPGEQGFLYARTF